MDTATRRLIIIRGPSGAGKSTVSNGVLKEIRDQGRLCAILEQDHFLNVIPGNQAHCRELCCEMMLSCALACKNKGYDVIMEGILNIVYCSEMIETLKSEFGCQNVTFYYFDVTLEETQARHLTRAKAMEFSAERMAGWYISASPTNFTHEVVISSQTTAPESIKLIVDKYNKDVLSE